MSDSIITTLNNFSRLKILVIGDVMLDCYLNGTCRRLAQEAPVPVMDVTSSNFAPGGAANTAMNIASLGGNVRILSVIGDDTEASLVTSFLTRSKVDISQLNKDGFRRTLSKTRVISEGQMMVRYDSGTTQVVSPFYENKLIDDLIKYYKLSDAVVVSDYGYGTITRNIIEVISKLQTYSPNILAVDSKDLSLYKNTSKTLVKPNYQQVVKILGIEPETNGARINQIRQYSEEICQIAGSKITAVSLDSEGAIIFEKGKPEYRTYAQPKPFTQSIGAGDTYFSVFTMALCTGTSTSDAAELASSAASIVVEQQGTAICNVNDIYKHIAGSNKEITILTELVRVAKNQKREGKRIIFTNGCFDILHRGHVTYLSRAKSLGDIFVVGINTDESIRKLKGKGRPINKLKDRVRVLSALSSVDYIIPFGEDTAEHLIRKLQPDIYVKGGDYSKTNLPEARIVEEYGGKVEIIPYIDHISTTKIINRIKNYSKIASYKTYG